MARDEPKIGQKIGNFEIVRELGRGAMGIVYKANQGTMNRFVALKVLSGALAGDQAYIRRFHREAQAAARLNHPNIITIHDQGEAAGFHYIATEYVTGTTLKTHIKMRGQLDASSALDIVLQAAEALEAAHSEEIVHRDIKPDNVMINGAGRVTVMDFGIAKLSGATAITLDGQILGTPYYMSPEQYRDSTSVDARSDLYSLGVVMFEMLAGRVPFDADSIPALSHKIINDPLPSLRALNSDVPEDISDIVKKLTAKHPEDRYQRATDLIADIKAWKRKQYRPVQTGAATSNSETVPGRANTRQPRTMAAWITASVIAVSVIALVAFMSLRSPEQVNNPAETQAMVPTGRPSETATPADVVNAAPSKEEPAQMPTPQSAGSAPATESMNGARDVPPAPAGPLEIAWNATDKDAVLTLPGNVDTKFVWIPPGKFMMGSPSNEANRSNVETQHPVTLTKGYWLGKYEVTQRQWAAVMGNNPSNFKGDDLPVETVSWIDCQEFIRKLNSGGEGVFSLPTEAEWEYACRSGSTSAYSFGGEASNFGDHAWYFENSGQATHPVGQKKPNSWGLYDMHGNVWEWCVDWYGDYPLGTVTDPQGASSGSTRVLRGGSWYYYAYLLRSAYRNDLNPTHTTNYNGFRVARSVSAR